MATRRKKAGTSNDVPPPRTPPDEKGTLLGLLNYLRERVIAKMEDVPEPDVRAPGTDTGTNLLGLVKHLGYAEHNQFLGQGAKSWPKTFVATDDETVEGLIADYREAIRKANEAIGACDLSDPIGGKSGPPLRWRLAHMVEETGRHAGQMDIVRERIDGQTGR